MKTKLTIAAIAVITLLSFAFTSNKKVISDKHQSEARSSQDGFTLQDRDQF